jgi:hypothetical protein
MSAMESLRELHVVQGRVTLSSGAMLARAIRAGVKVEWLESSDKAARLKLTRGGVSYEQAWTMEDAKRAQLLGKPGPWQQYPGAMLRARAISAAVRAFCPDVIGGGGLYTPEEARDIEPAPAPGSTGSPEVRVLSEALHEADEVDPSEPDPIEHVMYSLERCRTDGDFRTWVFAVSEDIERERDSTRKRDRWKAVVAKARGVTPPVRVDENKRLFAEARARRAAKGSPETSQVTADPLARALDELSSAETAAAFNAWAADNMSVLASIEVGSALESQTWTTIRKAALRCGDSSLADELSEKMS